MKNYQWKIPGFAKGINPTKAVKEIERIEKKFGALTPEKIVQESQDKRAIFHDLFEWDNNKAAHNYRLQQARTLINNIEVRVIYDGEERIISVYEVTIAGDEKSYKNIEMFNVNDFAFVQADVVRQLNNIKTKLAIYNNYDTFKEVINYIDAAIKVVTRKHRKPREKV